MEVTRSLSKGSVLKSGWVYVNPAETRIIDSNALAEQKLREMATKLATELGEDEGFADGFMQGLDAVRVSELVDSGEVYGEYDGIPDSQRDMFSDEMPEEQSVSQSEELINEAYAQIEAMKQEAIAEIEQQRLNAIEEGRQAGYSEGYEQGKLQGYNEGHQEGLNSVDEQRQEIFADATLKIANIEAEYKQKLDELEPRFIETLTEIYEHIFHVSLKNYRELIVYLIQNTLRNVEATEGFLVHISKEDYPFVTMQKKELVKGTSLSIDGIELIEDATLSRNECMVETGNGVFDCSLGTQLEALNEELRLLAYQPK